MKPKFYAVSRHVDQIRYRAKQGGQYARYDEERTLFFDSEVEAHAFIQDRAFKKVEAAKVGIESAKRALRNAERHLEKMRAKFPVSLA